MGQEIADPRAALTVLRKLKDRAREWQHGLIRGHSGEALSLANRLGQVLAVQFVQARLVVEEVHLGRTAALKQINHALCARGEMHCGNRAGLRVGRE